MTIWRNAFCALAVFAAVILGTAVTPAASAIHEADTDGTGGVFHGTSERMEVVPSLCAPDRLPSGELRAQSSGASFNERYGNQLSGLDNELYNSLVSYYGIGRKAGTFEFSPGSRRKYASTSSSAYAARVQAVQRHERDVFAAVQNACDALMYDYPEIFWINGWYSSFTYSCSFVSSGNSCTASVVLDSIKIEPVEVTAGISSNIQSYDSNVRSAVNTIAKTADAGKSRYHLVKIIHDYVCNLLSYYDKQHGIVHSSAPSFIGDHMAVCEGYAKTFKVLCDQFGIPCICVVGIAGEPHMWNYVRMNDGKWYLVDTTWDDQQDGIRDVYFLAGSDSIGFDKKKLSAERTLIGDFSGAGMMEFAYPSLNASAFRYVATCTGGHTYKDDAKVEATCLKTGKTAGSHCSVCGIVKTVQKDTAAKGHTAVKDPEVAATCTKQGKTEGSHCSVCSEVLIPQETIPAKGHSVVNDPGVEATCTKAGKTAGSHCSVCREVLTPQKTIPAKGHSVVKDPGVEATCTEPGKTEGSHCSVCREVLSAQRVIPAKGHTIVEDPAVAATETTTGLTRGSHCSVCFAVIEVQKVLPRLQVFVTGPETQFPSPDQTTSSETGDGTQQGDYSKDGTQQSDPSKGGTQQGVSNAGKISKTLSLRVKVKKNKVTVSWKKIRKTKSTQALLSRIRSIRIQYSTDPSFRKNVRTKKIGKNQTKITLNLKKKKTWYIRARYEGKGGAVSAWSGVKKVSTALRA